MTAKLTPELAHALQRAGDNPLPVEDPQTHRVYVLVDTERYAIVPRSSEVEGGRASWPEEKNARRSALVHKKFTQGLAAAEAVELERLQQELLDYRKQVVPLPYDVVDSLEAALLPPPHRRLCRESVCLPGAATSAATCAAGIRSL